MLSARSPWRTILPARLRMESGSAIRGARVELHLRQRSGTLGQIEVGQPRREREPRDEAAILVRADEAQRGTRRALVGVVAIAAADDPRDGRRVADGSERAARTGRADRSARGRHRRCARTAPRATSAGEVLRTSITPPAAFPYSDDALPRTTSTRSAPSTSTTSTGVCPSGSVSGTPSWSTRTPRTPNAERAPKPRMLTRGSCAGFCRLASATPGMAKSSSSAPSRRSAASESGRVSVTAYGSSIGARGPSRVAVTRTTGSAAADESARATCRRGRPARASRAGHDQRGGEREQPRVGAGVNRSHTSTYARGHRRCCRRWPRGATSRGVRPGQARAGSGRRSEIPRLISARASAAPEM